MLKPLDGAVSERRKGMSVGAMSEGCSISSIVKFWNWFRKRFVIFAPVFGFDSTRDALQCTTVGFWYATRRFPAVQDRSTIRRVQYVKGEFLKQVHRTPAY